MCLLWVLNPRSLLSSKGPKGGLIGRPIGGPIRRPIGGPTRAADRGAEWPRGEPIGGPRAEGLRADIVHY